MYGDERLPHSEDKMGKYITFASRGDTLSFLSRLRKLGVPCQTAPTPVKRGDLCAVSVKVDEKYMKEVKNLLSNGYFRSFRGIY